MCNIQLLVIRFRGDAAVAQINNIKSERHVFQLYIMYRYIATRYIRLRGGGAASIVL